MAYQLDAAVYANNNFYGVEAARGCCPAPQLAAAPCATLCSPPVQCCSASPFTSCDGGRRYHLLATAYGRTTADAPLAAAPLAAAAELQY